MIAFFRRVRRLAAGAAVSETSPPSLPAADPALLEAVKRYSWYHRIEVAPGVFTPPAGGGFPQIWDFILGRMRRVDFAGRRVLDVGCRDGLFSFEAERRGAAEVIGIDNDLSPGAVEFLIPHFRSRVRMEALNLYQLDPGRWGRFDIILFFGVLYHLRYPMWGLRRLVDCLAPGGLLLIESGMLVDTPATRDVELLYCPVERSPYEPTSCTFFNRRGLETTLGSLGLTAADHATLEGSRCPSRDGRVQVERQFFVFRADGVPPERAGMLRYWDALHAYHSVEARNDPAQQRKAQETA